MKQSVKKVKEKIIVREKGRSNTKSSLYFIFISIHWFAKNIYN